jgi:hypothetical protein
MLGVGRRGRSRRILGVAVVAVAFSSLASVLAASAADDGPLALLEQLAETLRRQPAWSSDYHQDFVPAGMTVGEEVDGRVRVAWPDQALFESGQPVIRLMGLEHRLLRLVDLDLPSCETHVLSDEEWARIPLAAVLDPRAALDEFTILDTGARAFTLVPRQPGGVARVEVVLGDDNLPQQVTVIDPQGAVNRLDFSGWRPSAPPASGWLPEAPSGVECVGEPAPAPPGDDGGRGRLRR